MKTKILTLALFAFLFANETNAQDVTTVNAKNSDISDNLDLRAVASIFGDSENLEDFERRLNDPKNQISNLDLNNDRQVDYLRVIEAVERNTHLIVLQAVLDRDVFQDIATIEVETDGRNNVQVQVVGDVYMYGSNYIYEPIYVSRPLIYNVFWVDAYRPYYSPYYWNYYPGYYYGWAPYPVYQYRNNVHVHIHQHNTYNYVNTRRSDRAVAMHSTRRANGYERQYPNESFSRRNNNVSNRYELEQTRSNTGTRTAGTRSNEVRNANSATATRSNVASGATRGNNAVRTSNSTVKNESGSVRNNSNSVRTNTPVRAQSQAVRNNAAPTRTQAVRTETKSNSPRVAPTRSTPTRVAPQRTTPARSQNVSQPQRSQRAESGNSRGNNAQRGPSRG